jgi:hypothetical protein
VSSTGAEKALSKNRNTLAASNITPLLVNLRRISTADNNRLRHHEYAVFIIMLRTIIFRVRSRYIWRYSHLNLAGFGLTSLSQRIWRFNSCTAPEIDS